MAKYDAAIDIGSNSVRLLTADGAKRSQITQLADGIQSSGKLSEKGVTATVAALKEYARIARGQNLIAFATEAVRRASDGRDFLREVKRETGLTVSLLSPEQEARLALFGATKPKGAVTVCDLGGGSMEIICSSDGVNPEYIKSLPLGVVVLKNRYGGDYAAATREADMLVAEYGALPKYPLVVLGGSACTIAAGLMNLRFYDSQKVNGYTVTASTLDGFLPVLQSDKLSVLRPICEKRADTVAYGAIILRALINRTGLDRFTVSDSDNLTAAVNGFDFGEI